MSCTRNDANSSYLLGELAARHWLAAKLQVNGVGTREARCIHDTDGSISVVDNVNVDVAAGRAANVTRDVTIASFSRVDVDDTLFPNGDCRPDSI